MSVRCISGIHGRKAAVRLSNQTKNRALDVIQENRSGCSVEWPIGFYYQIGCSMEHGAMDHIVVDCLFLTQSKHRSSSECEVEFR
jgi:hypothetical protein